MRVYSVELVNTAVTGAITLVQLKAGNASLVLLRAFVKQLNQTASAMQDVGIIRKTGAATVTSATPVLMDPDGGAALAVGGTSATGTNASAEGTDAASYLVRQSFNVLNGWDWIPTPEERIEVGATGIIALKFPSSPGSSMTVNAGLIFGEIG